MVQLGPDYDLSVRLKNIEDAIARLTGNPLGSNFSQTQSDGTLGFELFQDTNSGATALGFRHGPNSPFTDSETTPGTVQHPRFLYIGQLDSAKLPTAAVIDNDAGFVLLRDDGSPMLVVTGTGGVQVFDKSGLLMLSTDETNGGLATSIAYPPPLPNTSLMSTVTGGTEQQIGYNQFFNYHAQLTVGMSYSGPPGSSFFCQVNIDDETPVNPRLVTGQSHVANGSGIGSTNEVLTLDETWIGHQVNVTIFANTATPGTPMNLVCNYCLGTGSAEAVTTFGLF